jgi:anti-sigma-K factor RskA
MAVPRAADVGGQIGAAAKRHPRIKLWRWIVIVGFAAVATDIALRLRGVPETSKFRQPSAAEVQAVENELDRLQKAAEESIRRSANVDEVLRRVENTQDGSRDLGREPRSPDGNGRIIQH